MKRIFVRSVTLVALILAATSSCGNFFQRESGRSGFASLHVEPYGSFGAARTIVPEAIDPTTLVYDLSLTSVGNGIITLSAVASNALNVPSIATGDWTLSLVGKKLNVGGTYDALYASASMLVTIVDGANPVAVQLDPLRVGTGTVDIIVSPETAAGIDGVWAYWTQDLAEVVTKPVSIRLTSPVLSTDFLASPPVIHVLNTTVTSGDWYLVVDLLKSGSVAASVVELVRVYDFQTTRATITVAASEISKAPLAPSGFAGAALSGGKVGLSWVDESNTETGFRIWRDGTVLPDITAPGVTSFVDDPPETLPLGSSEHAYSIAAFNSFGPSPQVPLVWAGAGQLFVDIIASSPLYHTLSFSSPQVTIDVGEVLPISTTNLDLATVTTWNWYVDGALQSVHDAGIDFSSTLPGQHLVSATVVLGGIMYSGSLKVSVDASVKFAMTYDIGANTISTSGIPPVDSALYRSGDMAILPSVSADLAPVLVPLAPFTSADWFFGWNTAPDGSGRNYLPEGAYLMDAADTTLYATWNAKVLVVGGGIGSLWGNGQVSPLYADPLIYDPPQAISLYSSGGHVYVAGFAQPLGMGARLMSLPVPMIWIDGVPKILSVGEVSTQSGFIISEALAITASGEDVHVMGVAFELDMLGRGMSSQAYNLLYWKNDEEPVVLGKSTIGMTSDWSPYSIAVYGGEVYIAGEFDAHGALWRIDAGGTVTRTDYLDTSFLTSVVVSGSDLYLSGMVDLTHGAYWKNDVCYLLPGGSSGSTAHTMIMDGTRLLIPGSILDGSYEYAAYWTVDVGALGTEARTDLGLGMANSIAIDSATSTIYVAGANERIADQGAYLWIVGDAAERISLAGGEFAYSVIVRSE